MAGIKSHLHFLPPTQCVHNFSLTLAPEFKDVDQGLRALQGQREPRGSGTHEPTTHSQKWEHLEIKDWLLNIRLRAKESRPGQQFAKQRGMWQSRASWAPPSIPCVRRVFPHTSWQVSSDIATLVGPAFSSQSFPET